MTRFKIGDEVYKLHGITKSIPKIYDFIMNKYEIYHIKDDGKLCLRRVGMDDRFEFENCLVEEVFTKDEALQAFKNFIGQN